MIKTSQPPRTLYNPLKLGNCPHSYTRLFVCTYILDLHTILLEKALTMISKKKQYHVYWTRTTECILQVCNFDDLHTS